MAIKLHPALDKGFKKGSKTFEGGTLKCHCKDKPVTVSIGAQIAHNHACGCTKCWKPKGAILSVVGVVSKDKVKATANGAKLKVVDESATIQRYACKECGVHMYGRIENKKHAFYGLDFVHCELSDEKGWQEPQFAAFVSSVIEGGVGPSEMKSVRNRIKAVGLESYDCLSPALMDALATQAAKLAGVAARK
jgi:S-(hydroxymethyl)glutathione synthase